MIKTKKAELHLGFVATYAVPFMFILILMGFILHFATSNYSAACLSQHPDLVNHIYAYRVINVCFAYQDPFTGRYYPGIIDITKYSEQNFNSCFLQTSSNSFNIKLIDSDLEKTYDTLRAGFGASLSQINYPVTIGYENGTINKGVLYFGVFK